VKLLLEDLNQAMEDFKKAVTLNPDFPIAYVQKCYTDFRYAYMSQDMNKVQEVTQQFEEALKRFPNCTEAYTLYAQVIVILIQLVVCKKL
jgi:import receptor subunit TOM70